MIPFLRVLTKALWHVLLYTVFLKFICWNPNHLSDDIRMWGALMWLNLKDETFIKWNLSHYLWTWSNLSPFLLCEDTEKIFIYDPRTQPSSDTESPWRTSRTVRNKFLLFISHTVYNTLLQQLKLTKTWCNVLKNKLFKQCSGEMKGQRERWQK